MRRDIFEAGADTGDDVVDDAGEEPGDAGAGRDEDSDAAPRGMVSEVDNLGDGSPIVPDQATAGHPDGGVQEGTAGPNARPRHNRPGVTPRDLDG